MPSPSRSISGLAAIAAASLLAGPAAATVTFAWAFVGSAGNAADPLLGDVGSVAHEYFIAKAEVTNAQYAEFLNAKAAESDPLGLYDDDMAGPYGGITRTGSEGSFAYEVKPGHANQPVGHVSFYDSLRFANWLNNGQGGADTETGAYTLIGGTPVPADGMSIVRNANARVFLPSEDEWHKAAYYDGSTGLYYEYPTSSNAPPTCAAPTSAPNSANCAGVVGAATDVGSYPGSTSPSGTYDQAGNVMEWNEQVFFGVARGVRLGDWVGAASDNASWLRGGFTPTTSGDLLGLRVASLVPEPTTGALVAIGLAALSVRRPHRTAKR